MTCNCNLCSYDRANPAEAREHLESQSLEPLLLQDSRWQQGILTVLQAVDVVLTDAGIPYWICGGTLLGALRHGGFIPHDDDADIECFEADAQRIQDAFAASPLLVQFCRNQGTHEGVPVAHISLERHHDSIDVFLRTSVLHEMPQYPSHIEVFPLQRVLFNGLWLNAPGGDAYSYLSRCYGPDWTSLIRVFFNHMPCRPRLQMELSRYQAIVDASNYEPPKLFADTAAKALLLMDRALLAELGKAHCADYLEAQQELWMEEGWGSRLPPPPNMEWS